MQLLTKKRNTKIPQVSYYSFTIFKEKVGGSHGEYSHQLQIYLLQQIWNEMVF